MWGGGDVYPHNDIQSVILSKWKPDVDSLAAFDRSEKHMCLYIEGRHRNDPEIPIFHVKSTSVAADRVSAAQTTQPPLFIQLTLKTGVMERNNRLLIVCVAAWYFSDIYSKEVRSPSPPYTHTHIHTHGCWRHKPPPPPPPRFVPGLLRAPRPVPSRMTNGLNEIGQLSIHA